MNKNDKFYVGDFTGDGKDDLFVFNGLDWSTKYFGMLRSTGKAQLCRVSKPLKRVSLFPLFTRKFAERRASKSGCKILLLFPVSFYRLFKQFKTLKPFRKTNGAGKPMFCLSRQNTGRSVNS